MRIYLNYIQYIQKYIENIIISQQTKKISSYLKCFLKYENNGFPRKCENSLTQMSFVGHLVIIIYYLHWQVSSPLLSSSSFKNFKGLPTNLCLIMDVSTLIRLSSLLAKVNLINVKIKRLVQNIYMSAKKLSTQTKFTRKSSISMFIIVGKNAKIECQITNSNVLQSIEITNTHQQPAQK